MKDKEETGYWKGWYTTAFIGMDKDGEPRYSPRRYFQCSHCYYKTVVQTNYCPNCGRKMQFNRPSKPVQQWRSAEHGTDMEQIKIIDLFRAEPLI